MGFRHLCIHAKMIDKNKTVVYKFRHKGKGGFRVHAKDTLAFFF